MGKLAVIFPGQGSQYVGMGFEFFKEYKTAEKYFHDADNILGYPISKIIFQGPEDVLRLTMHTQPAILLTSIAIFQVIQEELNLSIDYMAGHSLGEYSALTATGNMLFKDTIRLVSKRGQFMEEAVPNGEGTMAAVMGMDRKTLEEICDEITDKGHSVQLANVNAPSQIVISGSSQGVEMASQVAKERGARRVIPLSVSGPFHSRLMKPAMEKLRPLVENTMINESRSVVVTNVTARPSENEHEIKRNLVEQVISPVLWTDSIEWMITNGVDTFIEVGPGKVLTGLVKKINKEVETYNVEDISSLLLLKERFAKKGGE